MHVSNCIVFMSRRWQDALCESQCPVGSKFYGVLNFVWEGEVIDCAVSVQCELAWVWGKFCCEELVSDLE